MVDAPISSIRWDYGEVDVYGSRKTIGVANYKDYVLITLPDVMDGRVISKTMRISHEDANNLVEMLGKVLK